jgi:Ribonuclease G/E
MYCDYCDGGGNRYSRRQGASLNEPSIVTPCPHCGGSGIAPNAPYDSLDKAWVEYQRKHSEHLGDDDYTD